MRRLIQAFCLVFLFYGFTLAGTDSTVSAVADSAVASTKYLHISTNPSHVDVYVNNIKPKHYKEPDYKMPGFIPVPAGESSIMVSIFRPEYADTTINVTLSQKDTSFLIVALRPNYDDKKTDEQYSDIARRGRRKIGHRLLIASIVPFTVSGIAAAIAHYNIEQADKKKDKFKKALFQEGAEYQKAYDKFKDYRDNADKAKNITKMGLILGGIVLTTGIIFSF
ncbi:MAG: hypothetical protein IKR75_04775 [Fibrobacter sp.]|nr:hypothetical protein [Fibrobacter sp.]